MYEITKELSEYSYPNKGILMGYVHPEGKHWIQSVIAFWSTERAHKEKRHFLEVGTDCICLKEEADGTFSEEYRPIRVVNGTTIVSSGAESEAIYQSLLHGKALYESLRFFREREYWGLIPRHPLYTPRIFGLRERNGHYALSILKSGLNDCPQQNIYEYSWGDRWISTVQQDGSLVPFSGEPVQIKLQHQTIRTLADQIWESFDPNTRVSLFVRYTDMRNGFPETVIINQFGKSSHSAPKKPIWPTRRNRK